MAQTAKIIRNFYRDSVALMQLSARISKLPGVRQASAVMASANNLALLREAGLLQDAVAASPNDLLIALDGDDEKALTAALDDAEGALNQEPASSAGDGVRDEPPRSIEMGLAAMPAANLALISTPGDYAAAEALKALRLGLNVMLFSDNVPVADEVALKRYARANDLIVMGPDCGTAIVNGIPLGFANAVRRGDIGLVGASGTGLQQVTCLVDRFGGGVSQALGTGGHDLSVKVGGISMLQGLSALAADAATKAIVLISKPPAEEIAELVLAKAQTCGKPVIVNFLGAEPALITASGLSAVKTLEDAAIAAARLAIGGEPDLAGFSPGAIDVPAFAREQRYVRGLFSGGTLCYEATMLLSEVLPDVYSNTPVGAARSLDDVWKSRAHTLIDLGDDVFTRGRPHPMIDHRLRNERIAIEAQDPQTAIILLDVVLGYGSHPDPASVIAPVIKDAIAQADAAGRKLMVVGSVCGTAADPQNLAAQDSRLRQAGMRLAGSNAAAVRLAAGVLAKARGH
jgi:succinyl-CoA synthetase alpha subunit